LVFEEGGMEKEKEKKSRSKKTIILSMFALGCNFDSYFGG
jgi:hypothetical protein